MDTTADAGPRAVDVDVDVDSEEDDDPVVEETDVFLSQQLADRLYLVRVLHVV